MKTTNKVATLVTTLITIGSFTNDAKAATIFFDITEETNFGNNVITYKVHGQMVDLSGLTFVEAGIPPGSDYIFFEGERSEGILRRGSSAYTYGVSAEITRSNSDLLLVDVSGSIDLSSTSGDLLPTLNLGSSSITLHQDLIDISAGSSFSFTAQSTDTRDFHASRIIDGVTSSASWTSNGETQQIVIRTGSAVPEPSSTLLFGLATFSLVFRRSKQ